jgi:hypothetical protein
LTADSYRIAQLTLDRENPLPFLQNKKIQDGTEAGKPLDRSAKEDSAGRR